MDVDLGYIVNVNMLAWCLSHGSLEISEIS